MAMDKKNRDEQFDQFRREGILEFNKMQTKKAQQSLNYKEKEKGREMYKLCISNVQHLFCLL